jgi:hypothetical protein
MKSSRWLRSPVAATNRSPGRTRRESAAMPVMSASAEHGAPIAAASSLSHLARRCGCSTGAFLLSNGPARPRCGGSASGHVRDCRL